MMSSGISFEASDARPSFAKVAASTYMPEVITATKDHVAGEFNRLSRSMPDIDVVHEAGSKSANHNRELSSCASEISSAIELNLQTFVDGNLVLDTKSPKKDCKSIRSKGTNMEDCNTASSCSVNSTKRSTGDDRSTESGTASILDEKESIRPDDSASLKASDDEDASSFSQSAGFEISRARKSKAVPVKSQIPAKQSASRLDQTHETWQVGTFHKVASPTIQNATSLDEEALPSINSESVSAAQAQITPDEKLLEALQTPRDRVFLLKLEQDIINFVENSKEPSIELPQTNSFHRLLAHRLADYYFLGHTVDNGLGAVRLHRTPYARLPHTLGNMARSFGLNDSDQRVTPTRMIMRRDSQPRANSLSLPSATSVHSTAGVSKPLNAEGDVFDDASQIYVKQSAAKAALSREEREAKYNEARQRIFGPPEDVTPNGHSGEEKDASRSNSISSKKRTRKAKDYQNDGFESRSQPNNVHLPSLCAPSYTNDICYQHYPLLVHNTAYGRLNADYPSTLSYCHQLSPQAEAYKKATWPMHQCSPVSNSTSNGHVFSPTGLTQDLSAEFQQSLQIIQNPTTSGQTLVASPTQVCTGISGQFDVGSEVANHSWHAASAHNPGHVSYQPTYQSPTTISAPTFGHSNSALSTQQYPYGILPDPAITNNKSKDQHPIPGSYNRQQQFNPQSQSFIPTNHQCTDKKDTFHDADSNIVKSVSSRSGRSRIPGGPFDSSMKRRQGDPSVLFASTHGLSHPLPQPVIASSKGQSTIAKWGIPSHLPPKPPPPALSSQSKPISLRPLKDVSDRSIGSQRVEGYPATDDIGGEGLLEVNQ